MKTIKFTAAAVLLALVAMFAVSNLAQAGREGGVGVDNKVCQANGTVTYYETFRGGETAVVAIVGDGATDLDVFVYDMQGRLVAQGIGPTDIERVSWFVPQRGTYRIVVVNLGNTWNRYGMATN